MRAVLVQKMREKYAEFGEICAKICCVYAAYMLHICGITEMTRARVLTLDKVRRNAEKCDRICGNMRLIRLYANFCKFMHR